MNRSLFGSVKGKLSKRSSWKSSKTTTTNTIANTMPQLNVSEAPPAYTPNIPSTHVSRGLSPNLSARRGASPASSMASITNDNDKYAFLSTFDTIFIVDDSGSMMGQNWEEARQVLHNITPICTARDKDGVDLYFFNHHSRDKGNKGKADGGYYNITDPRTVNSIFEDVQPRGQTPTGMRLQSILKPYVAQLSTVSDMDDIRPVNIIVITDGCPSDDPESVIVQHAKKLDKLEAPPYQAGIQFFQVGNSCGARDALRELDDDLADQGVRDMVDASTWDVDGGVLTAEGMLKVVLGAVVRKVDRRRTSGERRRG